MLILKDDNEILVKGLRISIEGGYGLAASIPKGASAAERVVDLAELTEELRCEVGGATSAEAVSSHWSDLSSRRSLLDRALIGRLSDSGGTPVADYLIGCFARCNDLRSRKGSNLTNELGEVFTYTSDLCVSYAAISLLNPGLFPQPEEAGREGVLRLLGPLRSDTLPSGFLVKLVSRLQEEGTLSELGLPLFARLAEECGKSSIVTDFSPAYRALSTLLAIKPLGALFATDVSFLPPLCRNGALLQMAARLGPFLGISCFPADVALATQLFPDANNPSSIEASFASLRMSVGLVQHAMTAISKSLLVNAEAKEPFFRFIAAACTLNTTRAQQWFEHAESNRLLHAIAPQHIEPPQTPRT